jgi:hypothetical protein
LSNFFPGPKYLGVSKRVNLVNCISWSPSGFAVKIVALDEDRVIGQTSNPNITFSNQIKLDAFTNMESSPFTSLCAVNVAQGPEAKSVATRGVHVAIDGD